jgi:hypothetical protein
VHVVQTNETVAIIAARYGSTVDEIVAATDLADPDLIYRGQVLTVPVASAPAALQATPILTGSLEDPTAKPFALPSPSLIAPKEGAILTGPVTLRWRWSERLTAGQFFAVYLWRDDQPGPCQLHFAVDPEYVLDLDDHPPARFRWTVRAIQGRQAGSLQILERPLTPLGPQATFLWSGPRP